MDWTVILKVLADESRLQIIHELLKHDASVTSLSKALWYKDIQYIKAFKNIGNKRIGKEKERRH